MKKNLGISDRMIRLLIVAAICAFYITEIISGTTAIILLSVGGILALTSLTGSCPVYSLCGFNTNDTEDVKH